MQLIIGLCGKAGSGKGEVSKILQKSFKTYILPFAKPLKELAKEFGWDGRKDEKGRKFLQMLGTDIGRAYNPNYWVDQWTKEAKIVLAEEETVFGPNPNPTFIYDILVADDTRFDNEAECIHKFGGYVLNIHGRQYDLGHNSAHASEAGIQSNLIDYNIDNTGSIEALEERVLWFIDFLKHHANPRK